MKIIGEGYAKKIGERNSFKCSECGAEYTDISYANACQAKHFDDRQRKRTGGAISLSALEAPAIRTKPRISVNRAAASLPPEDDDIPVLTARKSDISNETGIEGEENDLQGLADRLMEQYK